MLGLKMDMRRIVENGISMKKVKRNNVIGLTLSKDGKESWKSTDK